MNYKGEEISDGWTAERRDEDVVFVHNSVRSQWSQHDIQSARRRDPFIAGVMLSCIKSRSEADYVYARLQGIENLPIEEVIDLMTGEEAVDEPKP